MIWVKVQRLANVPKEYIPTKMSAGSVGFDLRSAESIRLEPGEWDAVQTGLRFEIPDGYEGQIRPRSGLAYQYGVTVLNAPGTIDSDFRGEVMVILINLSPSPVSIRQGERIAQIVFQSVPKISMTDSEELEDTERGQNGLGSTGII